MIFKEETPDISGHTETSRIWWRVVWGICFAVLLIAVFVWWGKRGADSRSGESQPVGFKSATGELAEGHFRYASEYLDDLARYEINVAAERIQFHLQKWVDQQPPDPDWIADPLFSRLPKRLGMSRNQRSLSRLLFSRYDVMVLREAYWMRSLANQIAATGQLDQNISEWLVEQRESLGEESSRELSLALLLFDWVVRNIQLEALSSEMPAGTDDTPLPPPPGARRLVWESLLIGRGDTLTRATILMRLARQKGVHVVMLAVRGDAEAKPWIPAAQIGGQLYLLDTRLGLPLPVQGLRGVATLENVIGDPSLLRQLDVDDQTYPIQEQDLEQIEVFIDAIPPNLSQRMKLVEKALPRESKTVLTVEPSLLSQQLVSLTGVSSVSLWIVPYEALRYRELVSRDQQAWRQRVAELFALEGEFPLAKGRRQHFLGLYHVDPPDKGAKAHYMECRIPDSQMGQISQEMLRASGVQDAPGADAAFTESFRREAERNLIRVKEDASYWLGVIAFEQQQYKVAMDYFKKRSIEAFPDGRWIQGAKYNLGRTYERIAQQSDRQEDREAARRYYLEDKQSPQYHGNLIRSRRIEP